MRATCDASRSNRGFTLLELIISITLLATVILVVTGAVRLGYRSVTRGESKMETLERFRASLTIIDAQIQSESPLTFEEDGVKRLYFMGARDSIKFATNYSIWGGRKGYVLVEYRVQADQSGKLVLYAAENMVGLAARRETKLLEGMDQMYFEYFYRESSDEEGSWAEEWSDDTKTPQKIRLRLVSGNREISLIMPVRAEAATQT